MDKLFLATLDVRETRPTGPTQSYQIIKLVWAKNLAEAETKVTTTVVVHDPSGHCVDILYLGLSEAIQ